MCHILRAFCVFGLIASIGFGTFSFASEPPPSGLEPAPMKVDDPAAPPSTDILDTLARTEKYKLFLKAVQAAGMEGELRKTGPMTVFAPTDEAFRKLPMKTIEVLLDDKARITAILQGHIVPGKFSAEQLAEAKMVKSLSQATLTITPAEDEMPLKVENACIVSSDIATTNGVVHAIDVVLMPK